MSEKIKTIKLIHLAICAGTLLAYLFIGQLSMENLKFPKVESSNIIFLAIPVFAIVVSNLLFKSQLKKIDTKLKLENQLPFYQTASLIRWAILEAAAFSILVLYPDFIIFGILIIVYMVMLRPTEEKIKTDLHYLN